jgi:ribose transport system ATP-binding protein
VPGGKTKALIRGEIDRLEIKCSGSEQPVSSLSGGNKQKVSFGKWIAKDTQVIIMDCPTRGVDIGVKQTMYRIMMDLKRAGKAILMISEELPELIGMSDRLVIMKDFKQSAEFKRSEGMSEKEIIGYMI